MTTPTSARHELYTRLVDVLDEGPAETLMSYLPDTETGGLATKEALAATELALRADLSSMEDSFKADLADFRTEMRESIASLRSDLRQLITVTVSGLFGIVAVIVGFFLATMLAG